MKVFFVINPSKMLSLFIGKCFICPVTEIWADFDGNNILLGSDDVCYNKCVFISGFEIIKFSAEDKIIDFVSLRAKI